MRVSVFAKIFFSTVKIERWRGAMPKRRDRTRFGSRQLTMLGRPIRVAVLASSSAIMAGKSWHTSITKRSRGGNSQGGLIKLSKICGSGPELKARNPGPNKC